MLPAGLLQQMQESLAALQQGQHEMQVFMWDESVKRTDESARRTAEVRQLSTHFEFVSAAS